jgi:hypothetical protein
MTCKFYIAILTAILAGVAAFCWFKAGTVKVMPDEAKLLREAHFEKHGKSGYAVWTNFDGSDMEFTLKRQSEWNRNGAFAAGAAAICQAAYVLMTEI